MDDPWNSQVSQGGRQLEEAAFTFPPGCTCNCNTAKASSVGLVVTFKFSQAGLLARPPRTRFWLTAGCNTTGPISVFIGEKAAMTGDDRQHWTKMSSGCIDGRSERKDYRWLGTLCASRLKQ